MGTTNTETSEQEVQKAAAVWILKTQECHRIPLSVMDAVIYDMQYFYHIAFSGLHDRILSHLRRANISHDVIEAVSGEFSDRNPLLTTYQQLQYFKEHFNLVVMTMVIIDCNIIFCCL